MQLYVLIDEDGGFRKAVVDESSGWEQFDSVALHVAGSFRFQPAVNSGIRVPAWFSLPVTFQRN